MSKITRRTVCAGLVALPAIAAVGIQQSTASGSIQETTATAASPDVIGRVIEIVSQHENIPAEILLSPLRTRAAVAARKKGLYLAYRISGKSLPEVGRRFGGRDHTTVLHAVRTLETRADADAEFQAELLQLARRIDPRGVERIAMSEVRMPRYRAA